MLDSVIVDISSHSNWPGNVLSNFAHTPFYFCLVRCYSMEGFIQSLKWPGLGDQTTCCLLSGTEAKRKGRQADSLLLDARQVLWWRGREFSVHSEEHYTLVRDALTAKFTQNATALAALMETGNCTLTHSVPEQAGTTLPHRVFLEMLTTIRRGMFTDWSACHLDLSHLPVGEED